MKLMDYIASADTDDSAFADAIGVTKVAVCRYKSGVRIPNKETMQRILSATDGQVQPNDFYNLQF